MKTTLLTKIIILAVATIAFISCKENKPQFSVEGTISNADTMVVYLERKALDETTILDSLTLDKEGKFELKGDALGYSEFYILRLNGQIINLAIDSTETITVNTSKDSFTSEYTVEGSNASSQIKDIVKAQQSLTLKLTELKTQFDKKEILQEDYFLALNAAIDEYKEKALNLIYNYHNSLAAYFALFQKVDGYLIFDPYEKKDLSAFRTVATVWDQYKSNSPRASQLKNFTLSAVAQVKQAKNQETTLKRLEDSTMVADHTKFYDITLADINNKNVSLSSLQGKVVILDFTAYQTEFSPAHNILINKVYTKHKGNVEVYQVSFDNDKHSWQNSAVNLPWICVRDEQSIRSPLMAKFNIQSIPTTFLINKKGEIVKRIISVDELSNEVQKIL